MVSSTLHVLMLRFACRSLRCVVPRYMVHFAPFLRGKLVLEVGAGAGLCGLLATQMAREVRTRHHAC